MTKKGIVSFATATVLMFSIPLCTFAHGGRTDSRGGHKDNKNKSGLGSYHYHCGGYPAHLHKNGVCPYKDGASSSSNGSSYSDIDTSGWIGDMYWDGDGFAKGWTKINGRTYYFDRYGSKVTGWVTDSDDNTYYLGSNGVLRTGWQKIGKSKYYFSSEGIMRTGWRMIQDYTYYFGNDGIMRTGWRKIADNVYYFGTDGKMRTGWNDIGDNTYYFKSNGVMLAGKYKISGIIYEFDEKGRLIG